MNHMMLIVRSAQAVCVRFIAQLQSVSKGLDSILRITRNKTRGLTCGYSNKFDSSGTLQARALKGAHTEPPQRRARRVAVAIGIALSIVPSPISNGSIDATQSVHELADIQLTEKQEACHDSITFKESSNRKSANNGSHWGYYQGRSISLKHAPDDYQFYWYWHYVSNRYGITEYDEPDYCKALHHLRVKGWQ
jgi:hypothetical protein